MRFEGRVILSIGAQGFSMCFLLCGVYMYHLCIIAVGELVGLSEKQYSLRRVSALPEFQKLKQCFRV